MIQWILTRMEENPNSIFYGKELEERFPESIQQAINDKILRRIETRIDGANYSLGLNTPYLVIADQCSVEAINEDDPEADPVPLVPEDLERCSLDLEVFAKYIQRANHLKGRPASLDDRLYLLGSSLAEGVRTAVILGFFNSEITALRCLMSLPNLLADPYHQYVVTCPSFAPTPVLARELAAIGVVVIPLMRDLQWVIDVPAAKRPPVTKGRKVVLSGAEEKEFDQLGFRVRLPVHVTSHSAARNSTVVTVDGVPMPVPKADFRLFMFLIQGLFQRADGYIPWRDDVQLKHSVGEVREDRIAPGGLDQALGRLRSRFKSPLGGLIGTDFIERKHGKVRVSTHPKFVTYDREGLLHHPDPLVRRFAKTLPDGPEHNVSF